MIANATRLPLGGNVVQLAISTEHAGTSPTEQAALKCL